MATESHTHPPLVVEPIVGTPSALDRIERRQDDLRRMQEEISNQKNLRQDDLRVAAQARAREVSKLVAKHQRELDRAESDRTDSIRKVDREDVRALANQLAVNNADISKRLSALELSLSEGKGKQLVSDPQTERLAEAVDTLVRAQASIGGQREGLSVAWYVFGGLIAIVGTLVVIGAVLVGLVLYLGRAGNPPIYVPAPAGTTLPTTSPQSVPR